MKFSKVETSEIQQFIFLVLLKFCFAYFPSVIKCLEKRDAFSLSSKMWDFLFLFLLRVFFFCFFFPHVVAMDS